MARQRRGVEAQLEEAGFSPRSIYALRYGLNLETIDQLKTAEWGSEKRAGGLAFELRTLPGLGERGFAEVVAFRAHGDARRAADVAPSTVSIKLAPLDVAKLDRWASTQGVSRTSAARVMLLDALAAIDHDERSAR